MKQLTKLWGNFKNIPLDKNNIYITKRLFFQKMEDPEKQNSDLYLAMNTLSGAVDIFTHQEGKYFEQLLEGQAGQVPETFLSQLRDNGYLFPSEEVEKLAYNMFLKRHKNISESNDKILPFFAIDTMCGMGCAYCFQKRGLEKSASANLLEKSVMDKESLDSAFAALDLIEEQHNKPSKWVVGFGGEPLKGKHAEMNRLFIEKGKRRGTPVVYFSNLAMLNDDLFGILADNAPYIEFIETTIDGVEEDHNKIRRVPNSFGLTTSNIDRLLKAGVHIAVRTNIGPENIQNIPSIAKFYENKGWFDMPNFKSIAARITDRHHDGSNIYKENEAMSQWLKLKDAHPYVDKMHDYNIAYGLFNLLLATELREVVDKVDFRVDTSPVIKHCPTDSGAEFVFTGKPDNAIYTCAECAGMKKFQIGTHYPYLSLSEPESLKWGSKAYIDLERDIQTLSECYDCPAATQCGGDCSLEAINAHGSAEKAYCKDIPGVISNFMKDESGRLYQRCAELMK